MRLDLAQFKKTHEDNKTATLKHPDGHKITVSKSSLNAKMRAQLKSLPMHLDEGGEIPVDLNPTMPAELASPSQVAQENRVAVVPAGQANAAEVPTGNIFTSGRAMGTDEIKKIAQQQSLNEQDKQRIPAQATGPTNYQLPASEQNMPNPMATANLATAQGMAQGYGLQEHGIQAEGRAKAEEGKQEVQAADKYAQQYQTIMADHQKHYQALDQEIQHTLSDIKNNHIDPDRYMGSKSTLGKVSTAIGLLLGGIGGGLLRQENPAMKFLNEQINRDVDAQRMEMNNKQNILGAFFKQLGNLNDATAMTKAFYTDLYTNELRKAAAQAKSPVAVANAQKVMGELQVQKSQALGPLALKVAALTNMKNGRSSPEMTIQMLAPEGQQHQLYEDLKAMQNLSAGRDNALGAFDQVSKLAGASNYLPFSQSNKQIKALTGPITAQLSKETAGRFTEQDAKYLETLWPAATDNGETIAAKRQAIEKLLSEKMHFPSLKPYGIEPPMLKPRINSNFTQR